MYEHFNHLKIENDLSKEGQELEGENMTYLKLDEDNQIYYEYVKPENDKSTLFLSTH